MSRDREKTDVKVKVLDMSGVIVEALKYTKDKSSVKDKENITNLFIGEGKLGYITTSKGIFVLSEEGIGSDKPITKENPYTIEFRPEYEKNGEKSSGIIPVIAFNLDDKDILGIPVVREESLDVFIRSFGSRLESNYYSWKTAMEKALKITAKKEAVPA